jgi:hypothetical protein
MIRPPDRKGVNGDGAPPVPRPQPVVREERRAYPRQAVAWAGKIMVKGKPSVACVVLNVSERGARLRLRLPIDLPGGFTLWIDRFGELPVEVLDQEQSVVRVAFLEEPERVRKFFRNTLPLARKENGAA